MSYFNSKFIWVLFFLITTSSYAQVQKGIDIDGEAAGDISGSAISFSADGNTMAVGARHNAGTGDQGGQVRVYSWDGSAWIQKGSDIDSEYAMDNFGTSVSMSADGNTVAIGALTNSGAGPEAGQVRIFYWNAGYWIQQGIDIDGEAPGDRSGCSVSISSDGKTVAIGAYLNNGSGVDAGHVRIYYWNGSAWIQKGSDIDGENAGDWFGLSVSMANDGNTVGIGAPANDGTGPNAGHTRVYTWDGIDWTQKGLDINGEAASDRSGESVSLSADGNTIAIGAPANAGGSEGEGHVRVYRWSGAAWIQKGFDLNGEAPGDQSGISVAISSDGNTVAIGATHNDDGGEQAGHARVYHWNGVWWLPKGMDMDGEAPFDYSGLVISLNSTGLTLAIGATSNSDAGTSAGHVRVYEYCETITSSIEAEFCDTYIVPSGDEEYAIEGIYLDTISRLSNCGDSIITINLTYVPVNVNVSILAYDTLKADVSGVDVSYQWIDCLDGSIIEGATDQVFGATVNGNYAIIINEGGCIDTSACYEINGVGLEENQYLGLKVYPNPSKGLVYIETQDAQMESIEVFDAVGRLVKTWHVSSLYYEINLENIERGLYSLLIHTSKGTSQRQIILN